MEELLKRCKKLTQLNLIATHFTVQSLHTIKQYLAQTLVRLSLTSQSVGFDEYNILKDGMPKLKYLSWSSHLGFPIHGGKFKN